MLTRRSLLTQGMGVGFALTMPRLSRAAVPDVNVTVLVINDVHACRIGDGLSPNCQQEGKTDATLLRPILAINNIQHQTWPEEIAGKPSGSIT